MRGKFACAALHAASSFGTLPVERLNLSVDSMWCLFLHFAGSGVFACCEVVLDMFFDACSRILALHLPHLYCAVGSLGPSASELALLIVGAECTRKY